MSKVTLIISSFSVLLLVMLISNSALRAPKLRSSPSLDKILVQVCAPPNAEAKKFRPTMLVLLTNNSSRTVYIDRHLSGVPISGHNSIVVNIVNAKSGKRADLRAEFKPIKRIWNADDFIALAPQYSYGLIIHLRDYFSLEPGIIYRIRFEYKILSPERVGSTYPWNGIAKSKSILVEVPLSDK
jgi:hypothetical protein